MNAISFQDPRTNDLLSRVSEDVSLLRQDVGNLFSHTARHALPDSAHKLADNAKNRLAAGRNFTAEQLANLKNQINQPAAAWVGGAAAVGLLAAGTYLLFRNHCEAGGTGQADKHS
jgi:hypothetical protein